jgi:hypothetical protein
MADEPRFLINGAEYEIPLFETFTIDECRVFYDWTKVHVEDVDETPVNSQMIAAFMQIAYMRGNPGIKEQTARSLVGASNFADALERFNAATEEDADPPAQTPSEQKPNESPGAANDSPPSSGTDSTTPSDTPANVHSLGGSPASESSAFRSMTSAG